MTSGAGSGQEARARLEAWREQGLDRRDPLRFHFIAALARRSAERGGRVRRLLDERLTRLVQAYEEAAAGQAPEAGGAPTQSPRQGAAPGQLAPLLADLAERRRAAGGGDAYPELEMLEYFRRMGARMRVDRQARASLAQAPDNAGPLNSALLAHRALALMHAESPGYLRHFLDYLDTLAWLETPAEGLRPRTGRKS